MVDYSRELRKLRDLRDNFVLRYSTSKSPTASEQEIRDAKAIKREILSTWNLAIQTNCEESIDELVEIEDELEKLATKKRYSL